MSARRHPLVLMGFAAATTIVGLVATEGVASAAGTWVVTAQECKAGGGKLVAHYPKPDKRVMHPTPSYTCSGGKHDKKYVLG